MVLFGENLASLMQPGWEPHYIDYAELKVIVAKIKQAGKQQDDADAASILPARYRSG